MPDPGEILIARKEQLVPSHKNDHPLYEYQKFAVTERRPGTDQIYAAIYELPPQKANYPYHYHMANEELFYIWMWMRHAQPTWCFTRIRIRWG